MEGALDFDDGGMIGASPDPIGDATGLSTPGETIGDDTGALDLDDGTEEDMGAATLGDVGDFGDFDFDEVGAVGTIGDGTPGTFPASNISSSIPVQMIPDGFCTPSISNAIKYVFLSDASIVPVRVTTTVPPGSTV